MQALIRETLHRITPPDEAAMEMARAHQETLAKPPHSLGTLEDISVQIAGLTGKVFNRADRRRVIVFASDNGVVEEGVASAPQSRHAGPDDQHFARGLTGVRRARAALSRRDRT